MPVPIIAPTPSAVSCTGPRMRRSRFSPAISLRSRLSGFVANRLLAINQTSGRLGRSGSIHAGLICCLAGIDPPHWFKRQPIRWLIIRNSLLADNPWPVLKPARALEKQIHGQDLDQVVSVVVIEIGVMAESRLLNEGSKN